MKRILVAAVAVALLLTGCSTETTASEPEPLPVCLVTDKAQTVEVTEDSSKQVYFIYSDCGVFQVFSLIDGINAELYARIQVGRSYQFETFGPRIELMGAYPQITEAIPVG